MFKFSQITDFGTSPKFRIREFSFFFSSDNLIKKLRDFLIRGFVFRAKIKTSRILPDLQYLREIFSNSVSCAALSQTTPTHGQDIPCSQNTPVTGGGDTSISRNTPVTRGIQGGWSAVWYVRHVCSVPVTVNMCVEGEDRSQ